MLRAPCMGRCDTAPVLELGHAHIDHATVEKVEAAIAAGHTHALSPTTKALTPMSRRVVMPTEGAARGRQLGRRAGQDLASVCADLAARAFRRARNGALCAPMQARAIWL